MYQKSSDVPTNAFSCERSNSSTTVPNCKRATSSEAVSGELRTRTFEAVVMRCLAPAACRACAVKVKANSNAAAAKSSRPEDDAPARSDLSVIGKLSEPSGVTLSRPESVAAR